MATPVPPPTTGKRTRAQTPSRRPTTSSTSPSSSSSMSSPETKIARSSNSPDDVSKGGEGEKLHRSILCTLPPTCNRHPITLANSKELERHYATYHAHVCEQPGCGCVFPEAKLLELHQTECHDPLAAARKEHGEKIFGCMVQTCSRLFQTPKARRLHMIEAHKYPKEFFFAVTNKGIGGLLKKWGEGASMVRGEWKARDSRDEKKKDKDRGDRMAVENEDSDSSSGEDEGEEVDMEELERTPRPNVKSLHPASPPRGANARTNASADVDALADGMSSLSLVPPSIRFGRGGRGGGLGTRGRGRGGRGGIVPPAPALAPSTPSGGHQRRASADTTQLGSERGRGVKRGHRVTASVGAAVAMDVSEEGGDVVLLPPSGGRGRGGRGRRGGRGGTR